MPTTGRKVFVACNADECPFNLDRQCRSSSISVGDNGICMNRSSPKGEISPTEGYVEIKTCTNHACDHWEENPSSGKGQCGLYENLFFRNPKTKPGQAPVGPFCNAFETQIAEPPNYSASV